MAAFSQHSSFNTTVFNKPISPSVYELVKHKELPVSEYTGTINVSVPLYNILIKDYNIPIGIYYNTNGIKVAQSSSPVGLGWSFTDFGSIVQHVLGKNDLYMLPPVYAPKQVYMNVPDYIRSSGGNSTVPIYGPATPDESSITSNPSEFNPSRWIIFGTKSLYKNYSKVMFDGMINGDNYEDYERDLFSLRLPSGKDISFFIDDNKKSVNVLSYEDVRISMTKNIKGYDVDIDFKVTDVDGTQYFFEQQHNTKVSTVELDYDVALPYWDGQGGGSVSESSYDSQSDDTASYSSWFITKIVYPKGDVVLFKYSSDTHTLKEYASQFLGSVVQRGKSYSLQGYNMARGVQRTLPSHYSTTCSMTRYITNYSLLDSIVWNGNRVVFDYDISSRIDAVGSYAIKGIQVVNINEDTVSDVKFYHSNFSAQSTPNLSKDSRSYYELNYRMRLDSVYVLGTGTYKFEYNSMSLPPKNSSAVDYWGFYNGAHDNNNIMTPNLKGILNGFDDNPFIYKNNNIDAANLEYCKASVLKSIKYPTGIEDYIEYSLNRYSTKYHPRQVISYSSQPVLSNDVFGFGLRVSKVYKIDSDGSVKNYTDYKYYNGKSVNESPLYKSYSKSYIDNPVLTFCTHVNITGVDASLYDPVNPGNFVG